MEEYRLVDVKRRNKFANSWSDSEPYIAKYEVRKTRKKFFLFGKPIVKTFFDEAIFEVSNHLCTKWLKDMEAKKGVWRTRK
jgi:hypothetical protein